MPGMSPSSFFYGFVAEDHEDWKTERSSIRRGFHLAVSAFHLSEHYFRYYKCHSPEFAERYKKGGLKSFQEELAKRAPSFRDIWDIANAYKHLYTYDDCSIASTGAIEIITSQNLEIDHDWDGDDSTEIIIRHRNGSISHFSPAIEDVMQMWSHIIIHNVDPSAI